MNTKKRNTEKCFSFFLLNLQAMELFGLTGTEYIGYLASLLVLVSFTMKDVKTLRLVNMTGCVLFIAYGFLMPTLRVGLPIIITNVAIFGVNSYYLTKKRT